LSSVHPRNEQNNSCLTNLISNTLKKRAIYQFIVINLLLIVFLGSMSSCIEDRCDQIDRYDQIEVNIEVQSLENQIRNFENEDQAITFLKENQVMANYFLDALQYPSDTILARKLFRLFKRPSIDSLIDETLAYIGNFDMKTRELESAYRFIKYHYPEVNIPRVQTIVTGLYNDLYVSDTLIVIGLDYFLGFQGKHLPDIPGYIIKRYSRESMVPIIMTFVSTQFNQVDHSHQTLMADMVNIGKSYYFVSWALPCVADSLIIGYSGKDMRMVRENQEVIWANLIENEFLYETDHTIKNKFVGEQPNIYEISEECPGRVGGWLGWQIVKKYMATNRDITITDLMAETDAHKIFQLSKYKPRNE